MVITKISGIGSAITDSIRRNSAQSAHNFNVRQAEKYLDETKKSGDAVMIEYAQCNIEKISKGEY